MFKNRFQSLVYATIFEELLQEVFILDQHNYTMNPFLLTSIFLLVKWKLIPF